jgi:CRP-like cAMP-binding protein
VSQSAACNRQHHIEERLARWLLSVQDCILKDELPLTQEFIANMLGTRRSGVTVAAGILQQAGIIRYSRGKITILNQQALEETACECYHLVQNEFIRLLGSRRG